MNIRMRITRFLPTLLSAAMVVTTFLIVSSPNPSNYTPPPIYGFGSSPVAGTLTTQTINTTTGTTLPPCKFFDNSESQSFIEREPPLSNPPKLSIESDPRGILGRMRRTRISIVGCTYNRQADEPRFRAVGEQILDLFHPASLISVLQVNSSVTDDPAKLAQWKEVQMLAYANPNLTVPLNTKDIATCRNHLLNISYEIRAHYMLVADISLFSTNASSFISNFEWNETDWAVMTGSLVKDFYYDLWSLRSLTESNFNEDIWSRVVSLCYVDGYCKESVIAKLINIHKKSIPMDRSPFEVRSAYGGAALYNLTSTQGCQYEGGYQISEHVKFNNCVREKNKGRIFINPRFTQ